MSKGLRLSSSPYPQLIETGARCELAFLGVEREGTSPPPIKARTAKMSPHARRIKPAGDMRSSVNPPKGESFGFG